jgi:hypothetical protein
MYRCMSSEPTRTKHNGHKAALIAPSSGWCVASSVPHNFSRHMLQKHIEKKVPMYAFSEGLFDGMRKLKIASAATTTPYSFIHNVLHAVRSTAFIHISDTQNPRSKCTLKFHLQIFFFLGIYILIHLLPSHHTNMFFWSLRLGTRRLEMQYGIWNTWTLILMNISPLPRYFRSVIVHGSSSTVETTRVACSATQLSNIGCSTQLLNVGCLDGRFPIEGEGPHGHES